MGCLCVSCGLDGLPTEECCFPLWHLLLWQAFLFLKVSLCLESYCISVFFTLIHLLCFLISYAPVTPPPPWFIFILFLTKSLSSVIRALLFSWWFIYNVGLHLGVTASIFHPVQLALVAELPSPPSPPLLLPPPPSLPPSPPFFPPFPSSLPLPLPPYLPSLGPLKLVMFFIDLSCFLGCH